MDKTVSDADRSRIYLRLAISSKNPAWHENANTQHAADLRQNFYDESIKADPHDVDAWFYEALARWDANPETDDAQNVLTEGLKANHEAPRLLAQLAAIDYDRRGADGVYALCVKAIAAANQDMVVLNRCAEAYYAVHIIDQALLLYERLASTYDLHRPVIAGPSPGHNPIWAIAEILGSLGQSNKAAEALDDYIRRTAPEDVFAGEWLLDGRYHDAAKQFPEAAKAYGEAARLLQARVRPVDPSPVNDIRLKQLLALAQSGQPDETQALGSQLLAAPDQTTILKLQVRLRNAGDNTLPITGVYDETTKASLQRCIAQRGCGPA